MKCYIKEIICQADISLITKPFLSFLKSNSFIDAVIIFGTNHLGACGLRIIDELGLPVPEEIAVISFDDY